MATQRKDGWWIKYARIAPGPKGRVPIVRRSEEEADREAELVEREARQVAQATPPSERFPDGTFGAFIYGPFRTHVHAPARLATKRKYSSEITKHILPARLPGSRDDLAYWPVADFGFDQMEAFKGSLRRQDGRPGPLSAKQKHSIISLLRQILSLWVMLERAQGRAPREDWKISKLPKIPKKKKREEPSADFTVEFMKACEGTWMLGPAFAALFLGLRRGEICGLTWKKIDRKKLTLTVSEQLTPETKDELQDTKSDERTIPIPPELLAKLDVLGDHSSEFVFTMPRPGRGNRKEGFVAPMGPILPNEFTKRIPEVCAKIGHRATPHDLRSYAASNLAALGVDAFTIMELLGHKEIDTTTIYVNSKNDIKRAALSRLLGSLDSAAEQVDIQHVTAFRNS